MQNYVFDLTIPKNGSAGVRCIKEELGKWAKKWIFQEEKGESGYEHYQVRMSLFKKVGKESLAKKLMNTPLKGHLSVTSGKAAKTEWSYVMKADTRTNGPWTDKDPIELEELQDKKLLPWQKTIEDECLSNTNTREVNVVYDPDGNSGKSFITKWMCTKHKCELIPPMDEAKDILQFAMSVGVPKAYMIDLPKAMMKKGKSMKSIWSAIETLKNGYMYDIRYKGQRKWFNSVPIWVFTNVLPNMEELSKDRWNIYMISSSKELAIYTAKRMAVKRSRTTTPNIMVKRPRIDCTIDDLEGVSSPADGPVGGIEHDANASLC